MQVGDRVRINTPRESAHGESGRITGEFDPESYWDFLVLIDGYSAGYDWSYRASELEVIEDV